MKLLGYLITIIGILTLGLGHALVGAVLVVIGGLLCDGIGFDLDGLGVSLFVAGCGFARSGYLVAALVCITLGVALSFRAREHGDWTDWIIEAFRRSRGSGDSLIDSDIDAD